MDQTSIRHYLPHTLLMVEQEATQCSSAGNRITGDGQLCASVRRCLSCLRHAVASRPTDTLMYS